MKWHVAPLPLQGDMRVRKVFAWLPVRFENDTKVWLQAYWIVERFDCTAHESAWTGWWLVSQHATKPELVHQ